MRILFITAVLITALSASLYAADLVLAFPAATPIIYSSKTVLTEYSTKDGTVFIEAEAVNTVSKYGTIYIYTKITDTVKVTKIVNKLRFPMGKGKYGFKELQTGVEGEPLYNVELK